MNHCDVPFDAERQLAELDPEERARTRREWCLLGEEMDFGGGPEAALNRAAYGEEPDEALEVPYYLTDEDQRRCRELSRLMAKGRTGMLDIMMVDHEGFDFELRAYVPAPRPLGAPPVVTRLAALTFDEAVAIYETASFVMWRYGKWFNMMVTIVPKLMGIPDEQFPRLMAEWNKAMKAWLARPAGTDRRRRSRRKMPTEPQLHLWMLVYEHGRDFGLHAHEHCVVPKELWDAFEEHARGWWRNAAEHDFPESALYFSRSYAKESNAAAHQNQRVRKYVLKSMDRAATGVFNGKEQTLDSIFKPEPYHASVQIPVKQIYGRCHELSRTAMQEGDGSDSHREKFLTKLASGDVDQVDSGWELEDYKLRQIMKSLLI